VEPHLLVRTACEEHRTLARVGQQPSDLVDAPRPNATRARDGEAVVVGVEGGVSDLPAPDIPVTSTRIPEG
jgi:hypothetical protein